MADFECDVVVFDVNETLFSLDALSPAFGDVGLDGTLVPLWFARLLRDGFALAAMGDYRPFADVAADALRSLDPTRVDQASVATVLGAFQRMEPHPDVAPALQLLAAEGIAAATLTNGSASVVNSLLERAHLAEHMERNLSVDDVRRWKPAPEPYLHAAAQLGADPQRLIMVAAHPWDCAGAQAAGLRAGWVNRQGARWPQVFPPPHAKGENLIELIRALVKA